MSRFVLLLIALLGPAQAIAFDQQSLLKVFFSVVLVRGYDTDGNLAYGSGVVVGENQVATNCHVLRKTTSAWVSQAEDVYPIVSIHADPVHDLCLLNTEKLPLQPVQLAKASDIQKGDEVVSIGHSNGVLTPLTSGGQVKSVYPFDNGMVVRTNARFGLGASGSPLFDGQGRLIGINTFKTPGRTAYFYAIPSDWIAQVAKLPTTTKLPIEGRMFWELADDEKPFFMQVALPHINEDWARLLDVSQRWIKAEPHNAEAWYEQGTAQEGLGQTEQAQLSFRQSVAINARHGESLFRLGVYASQRGDRDEVHNVSVTLAQIDPEMADKFKKAVGCPGAC